jgi:hypothetical protein
MIAPTFASPVRRFAPTCVLLTVAACGGGSGISGSGDSAGVSRGTVSGSDWGTVSVTTPGTTSGALTSGSVISRGVAGGSSVGASGTVTLPAGDIPEAGPDGSSPAVATTDGGVGRGSSGVSSSSGSSSGSSGGAAEVDGAASDPWDGDPFADVAPPNEPPDASYPDPANDGGAVTWADWVSGFSNVYCVACHNPQALCGGSGCHIPSNPQVFALSFDMREKSSWTERAATIQCGIVVTQNPAWTCNVPPENYPKMVAGYPLPTDEARAVVANWIAAGCP